MPTYRYLCSDCELVFEEFHSMSETVESCRECKSPNVKRVPSFVSNIKKNNNFHKTKPGSVVKDYIKNVKEEVKAEKRRLSTQEYKDK